MTLIVPDGFGVAVAHFTFTTGLSNPMNMVFGFANPSSISGPDAAEDIGDALATVFAGPEFTNQVVFDQLSVTLQPGDESGVAIYAVPGGTGDPALPPNSTYLAHKRSTTGGRPGRGRMYWPSVAQQVVAENGQITPAVLATLNSLFGAFLVDLGTAGLPMVILHTSAAISPSVVIQLTADPVIATQRRRLRS